MLFAPRHFLVSAFTAAMLLSGCGGDSSDQAKTSLDTNNRELALADALELSVNGSLLHSLAGYYIPEEASGTASTAAVASESPATVEEPEVIECAGGGSITIGSKAGAASWLYQQCQDEAGLTLNGLISSEHLEDGSYAGEFIGFTLLHLGQQAIRVDGTLIYAANAAATILTTPSLRLRVDGALDLTIRDYRLQHTDIGVETRIEAKGKLRSAAPLAYDIVFDNTAESSNQAPFYLFDGDSYPYSGKLAIQDSNGNGHIHVDALNNIQVAISYVIHGREEQAWQEWSTLL